MIYQEIPETTSFYVIQSPCDELLQILEWCNGKLINNDKMTPDMQRLADALETDKKNCHNPNDFFATCITRKHKIPPRGAFDRVFSFGWKFRL